MPLINGLLLFAMKIITPKTTDNSGEMRPYIKEDNVSGHTYEVEKFAYHRLAADGSPVYQVMLKEIE